MLPALPAWGDRVEEMPFSALDPPLVVFLNCPTQSQKSYNSYKLAIHTEFTESLSSLKGQSPNNDCLQELKINNVPEGQTQWSMSSWACWHTTYRLVLLQSRCCCLTFKLAFPTTIFLDNNLGQDSYTVFLWALSWVPDPNTFTGHLDGNY